MTSELERFKTILATICVVHPEMSLTDALLMADAVEKAIEELPIGGRWEPDMNDPESVAKWLREQPSVRSFMAADQRINAIKEARVLLGIGLKEAKEAVETAFPRPGVPPF